MQPFVEGSGYVQLLSNITISDLDHQESVYLTQATVYTPPTSSLCVFIPILKRFVAQMNNDAGIITCIHE